VLYAPPAGSGKSSGRNANIVFEPLKRVYYGNDFVFFCVIQNVIIDAKLALYISRGGQVSHLTYVCGRPWLITFLQWNHSPDIAYTLLQFINVMNFRLVEPLLHSQISPQILHSQPGSDLNFWEPQVWWNENWCLIPEDWVCKSTVLLEDIINSPEISRMTRSYRVSNTSWQYEPLNLTPQSTNIRFVFPNSGTPMHKHHYVSAAKVSQGNVVTCLRFGKKYNKNLVAYLLQNLTVK